MRLLSQLVEAILGDVVGRDQILEVVLGDVLGVKQLGRDVDVVVVELAVQAETSLPSAISTTMSYTASAACSRP